MEDLLDKIANVDENGMERALTAIRKRYHDLYPAQDLHLLVIDSRMGRNEQIDKVIALLRRMKK